MRRLCTIFFQLNVGLAVRGLASEALLRLLAGADGGARQHGAHDLTEKKLCVTSV